MKKLLFNWGIDIAWVIALAATLGSLFWSEILQVEPCPLCWYQRICLFPLSVMLGIAAYRQERTIALYALPLVIVGALIALYQFLIQNFQLSSHGCRENALCTQGTIFLNWISLPVLSLVAFLLLGILLFASRKANTSHS